MAERVLRRFSIINTEGSIYKTPEKTDKRLLARLENETVALTLASRQCGDLVPPFSFSRDGNKPCLVTGHLDMLRNPDLGTFAQIIEQLQTIPVDNSLSVFLPEDYRKRAGTRMRFLRRWHFWGCGLSKREINLIRVAYERNLSALSAFDPVFVHGDVKKDHIGVSRGTLAIFDFDQAHFGNPLEDWAFLAVREKLETKVEHYLRQKYSHDPARLASLPTAFKLMMIDTLLGVCFNRSFYPRGNGTDWIFQAYSRRKLLQLARKI